MEKDCKICGSRFNLEDFEPKSDIYQIMKKEDLCFQCAYWTWRLSEDKKLQRLHDSKDLFLAKLRKEELDDMAHWGSFEQSDETLLLRYLKWWFGRPVILEGSHYIYYPGEIHKPSRIDLHYNYILMDDGTIYPYLMGLYGKEGLTHQGEIPLNFRKSWVVREYWNELEGFEDNAILLSESDIEELKARGMKTPFINQPNKVPEKIVKLLFEKFYIK